MSNIEREASSKSIQKTLKEIQMLMAGKRISPTGLLRKKLHDTLYSLLSDKACWWYERGFRRGHESAFLKGKDVPRRLTRKMRLHACFLPVKGQLITLASVLAPNSSVKIIKKQNKSL